MSSRMKMFIGALAAVLVGMPLAEKASAEAEDIVFSAIDLAAVITDAAVSAS